MKDQVLPLRHVKKEDIKVATVMSSWVEIIPDFFLLHNLQLLLEKN